MKNSLICTLIALSFVLVGCVTRGKNFNSNTSWLDSNKPNATQVETIMGPPFKVGSSNGTKTWTYGYYRHQLFGESLIKELKLYWNQDSSLKSYSFSSSFPEDIKKK